MGSTPQRVVGRKHNCQLPSRPEHTEAVCEDVSGSHHMLHDVEHGYEVELAVSSWDVLARPHPKRHPLVDTSPLREAACLLHDWITDLDPDDRFRPVLEEPDRPAAVAAAEVENRLAAEQVRSVEPPVKRPLRF